MVTFTFRSCVYCYTVFKQHALMVVEYDQPNTLYHSVYRTINDQYRDRIEPSRIFELIFLCLPV